MYARFGRCSKRAPEDRGRSIELWRIRVPVRQFRIETFDSHGRSRSTRRLRCNRIPHRISGWTHRSCGEGNDRREGIESIIGRYILADPCGADCLPVVPSTAGVRRNIILIPVARITGPFANQHSAPRARRTQELKSSNSHGRCASIPFVTRHSDVGT